MPEEERYTSKVCRERREILVFLNEIGQDLKDVKVVPFKEKIGVHTLDKYEVIYEDKEEI